MKNPTRRARLFGTLVLTLTIVLPGCAAAVDEDEARPPQEAETGAATEALTKSDASRSTETASDCDAAPDSALTRSDAYQELTSLLGTVELDASKNPEAAASGCTRICACCKRGNRFCCSHCDFCSGPIKLSPGVLAK